MLHCDDASGLLVVLLKADPGAVAGLHKHFAAAHASRLPLMREA